MRRSSNNNKNFNWKDKVMKDKGVPSSSVTSSRGRHLINIVIHHLKGKQVR